MKINHGPPIKAKNKDELYNLTLYVCWVWCVYIVVGVLVLTLVHISIEGDEGGSD